MGHMCVKQVKVSGHLCSKHARELGKKDATSKKDDAPTPSKKSEKSWAEMSMEDDDENLDIDDNFQFPDLGKTFEDVGKGKIAAEQRELKNRDRGLGKLTQVTIRYGRDMEQTRVLRVTSLNFFTNLEKVISMIEPSLRTGRIDFKDRAYKIKAANELMTMCYKHPAKQFCFVYAIAEIALGDGKVLRTGNIRDDSKKPFKLVLREYFTE